MTQNTENQETVAEYKVNKLSCSACAASAQKMLANQNGVIEAEVSFEDGKAKIRYIKDKVSPEKLKASLDILGYELLID